MPALDTSKAAFGKPGGRVIQSARCSSTPRRQDETCVMDVGLMLGPPTEWDVDGTGIVIDAHGEVVYIAPGGMAARWKEIKAGDMLLSISGATYVPGTPLSAYLEPETKRAYLVTVRRLLKADRFPLMSLVARTALDSSRTPRFASEREAAQALENAGCYHQGLKGAYKLTHTELEKAAHSILEKPELMAKCATPGRGPSFLRWPACPSESPPLTPHTILPPSPRTIDHHALVPVSTGIAAPDRAWRPRRSSQASYLHGQSRRTPPRTISRDWSSCSTSKPTRSRRRRGTSRPCPHE